MNFHGVILIGILVVVPSTLALKCYICNTEYPDTQNGLTPEDCLYPKKSTKLKTTECTPSVLSELGQSWMNENWNWERQNIYPNENPHSQHGGNRKPEWEYGDRPKKDYELKCMKEVLHNKSKKWLDHLPNNFTQTVRFCEYRRVSPDPKECEKECDPIKSKEKGQGCYICCSTDGCNGGHSLSSLSPLLLLSLLPIFLKYITAK